MMALFRIQKGSSALGSITLQGEWSFTSINLFFFWIPF